MMYLKGFIEAMFSLGLFINALLFVPQIIKLWRVKDSKELSLLTFAGFNFIQFFIVLHGLLRKDYLLFIGSLMGLLTCGLLTALIIFYRVKISHSTKIY